MPALDAPYGAEGTRCKSRQSAIRSLYTMKKEEEEEEEEERREIRKNGGAIHTLFGRYDAILAVKTILPLTPCLINALAAHRAE